MCVERAHHYIFHFGIIPTMAGVLSKAKDLHPPLNYGEFLKRNEDALSIRVVVGGQTLELNISAFGAFFEGHLQGQHLGPGITAQLPAHSNWIQTHNKD